MKPMSEIIHRAPLALVPVLLWTLSGCDAGPKSAAGFRLPDGDAARGKAAFVALQCYACHTVSGADVPPPLASVAKPMPLGGEVTRIRTYGDLVTSLINPSHRLSEAMPREWRQPGDRSPMPALNERMTVAQMIDLVAFLQPRYHLAPDENVHYR